MGIASKAPKAPPPQPYLGPGRNATESNLRDKGYDANLDDSAAINAFLAQHYGGQQPSIDAAPAKGTVAYQNWEKQQAAKKQAEAEAAAQAQQAALKALDKKFGYTGPTGSGERQDYFNRNPHLIAAYEKERKKITPDFSGDKFRNYSSAAKSSLNSAKSGAQSYVSNLGLNYNEFAPDIESELDRIYKSIPYGASGSDYFDPNLPASVLNRVEGQRKTKYLTDVENMFTPDYTTNAFADTSDDDIINRILDEQFGTAQSQLQSQRDRGQLLSSGYDSALSDLGKQRQVGSSKLQEVGGRVLTRNRGAIDEVIGKAKQGAAGYRLGQTFDPTVYKTQAETKRNELSGRLENDVRSELGGENLFDITSVLQRGYQSQGAQNTGRASILDALTQREEQRKQQRGVGSEGAF